MSLCPLSNIKYNGVCPVKSCPANISDAPNTRGHGCAYQFLKHTSELNLHEAAIVKGITLNRAKTLKLKGQRRINSIIFLYNVVEKLDTIPTCKDCSSIRMCDTCKKLLMIAVRVSRKFPFNNKGMHLTDHQILSLLRQFNAIVAMTNLKDPKLAFKKATRLLRLRTYRKQLRSTLKRKTNDYASKHWSPAEGTESFRTAQVE